MTSTVQPTAVINIRRLAAVDMHGSAGTRRRRSIILAEFVLGATVGTADTPAALRYYTAAQVWIFVPLLFLILAPWQAMVSRRRTR